MQQTGPCADVCCVLSHNAAAGAYELFFLVGALILTGLAGERSLFMNIAAAFSGV